MNNKQFSAVMLSVLLAGCSSPAAVSSVSEKASEQTEETAGSEVPAEEIAGVTETEVNGVAEQEEITLPEEQFARASQAVQVKVNVYDQDLVMPFDAKELTSLPGVKASQSEDDKLIRNTNLSDGYCTLTVTIDKNNKITRISDNQSNYWGLMTENGLRRGLTESDVLDALKKQNVQYAKEEFNDELWMYYYEVENDDFDYPYAVYTYTCGKNGVYAVDVTLLQFDEYYFTAEDLASLAANCCSAKAGEWPPYYNISINLDGTFTIELYEDAGDHTAAWAWYKVNRMGKGIDLITNEEVNFLDYIQ